MVVLLEIKNQVYARKNLADLQQNRECSTSFRNSKRNEALEEKPPEERSTVNIYITSVFFHIVGTDAQIIP